eukprot:TRINITY_DN102848_c0_g1_i1.p1 TRINITY_DN102848_c0_g1~~TRINITY_DN102848_c0_g1_i1.p1  ORF type:complete len:418 (+),score=61.28 TRINITY_DN102848_c0_g1_i1:53-1306(+)
MLAVGPGWGLLVSVQPRLPVEDNGRVPAWHDLKTQTSSYAENEVFPEEKQIRMGPSTRSMARPSRRPSCDTLWQAQQAQRDATRLCCPLGHRLCARITKEIWHMSALEEVVTTCRKCSVSIPAKDAYYSCDSCGGDAAFDICSQCSTASLSPAISSGFPQIASRKANLTDVGCVGLGDIVLCGPNAWGVHHVALVREPLKRETGDLLDKLGLSADCVELLSCKTVECSVEHPSSDGLGWHFGRKYFARHIDSGRMTYLGNMEDGSRTLLRQKPQGVKWLLHPMRESFSQHAMLDRELFQQAIDAAAVNQRAWSLTAAAWAMARYAGRLDLVECQDAKSRAALLEDIRSRWEEKQFCSSVVIQVWQRYLEKLSGGPKATEKVLHSILQFIPLLSDSTLPSNMVEVLSACGWALRQMLA